jgi:hypothetical protein
MSIEETHSYVFVSLFFPIKINSEYRLRAASMIVSGVTLLSGSSGVVPGKCTMLSVIAGFQSFCRKPQEGSKHCHEELAEENASGDCPHICHSLNSSLLSGS